MTCVADANIRRLFFLYFFSIVKRVIESLEDWTPAQHRRLDRVDGEASFAAPPSHPDSCVLQIRIFFEFATFFLSRFKNFPIGIHSRETRPTRCATILLYCSARDWTRFFYVTIGFENVQIHRMHVIEFVTDLWGFFSTLENGYKTAECVLTEASSGKKKLQIKNILGQDLNDVFFSHEFTNLVIIFALTKCHE